ncbi:hypothetical protein FRC02_000731 [Tulasnella sp. 418]|nr:hypothetical protein FRC02_000731 [Tulasnella sp. 418]
MAHKFEGVKNPIKVASQLLSRSRIQDKHGRVQPLLVVSSGAHNFATEHSGPFQPNFVNEPTGSRIISPEEMVTQRAKDEWSYWKSKIEENPAMKHGEGTQRRPLEDTVGAVVLIRYHSVTGTLSDAEPNRLNICLAAGVSSGGILLKLPGRVGEAAIYGAGCWASERVAVSVSGTGEQIIRAALARTLGEAVERCLTIEHEHVDEGEEKDIHTEIERVMRVNFCELCDRLGEGNPQAGAIILIQDGSDDPHGNSPLDKARLYCIYTTESMAIGHASWDPKNSKLATKVSTTL